jgi:hypothetical protein
MYLVSDNTHINVVFRIVKAKFVSFCTRTYVYRRMSVKVVYSRLRVGLHCILKGNIKF